MGSRVTLRGDYDIWRRDELRAELERLDLSGDITLDMSGVTLVDAGCAAMLIGLQRRLQERTPKARVILLNAPRIVRRVLELCGAADLFVHATER
ncbi:MAG TPA: STAS domain-containing protein [Candidatus Baltobacteraceae bacterium]|nr:STAS domain-containing protein [Candidatus Baltobacteraceae bacterium]